MSSDAEELGLIRRTFEKDLPVIFKLVDDLPGEATRADLPWLTVISWSYDGSSNNGMPVESVNESMIRLVADRDQFVASFNDALEGQPPYPLEINFFHDAEWEDFRKLRKRFAAVNDAPPDDHMER